MFDPAFVPTIRVETQKIFSTSSDYKNCILPVASDELIAGERSGKILRLRLVGDGGCTHSVVFDNNHSRPITDVVTDNAGKIFFVDSERVQLKESISRHNSSTVLQNVSSDDTDRGKVLKLFAQKNLLYVKGNESNTIVILNQDLHMIEQELTFTQFKKSRRLVDFAVNPKDGSILALSNAGDIAFNSVFDDRPASGFSFAPRECERFRSLAVNWEKGLLVTAGTQTVAKYIHKHIIYVFDISDPANIVLKTRSKVWETQEQEFVDGVSHVFIQEVDSIWHIVCFTNFTSSSVVFRYDADFNEVAIVSFPQRLSKGQINDVRQGFGAFWVSFESQDMVKLRIHSPN